jgi:hypothetical protein
MLGTMTGHINVVKQKEDRITRVRLKKVDKNIEETKDQPESEALPCEQNTKHLYLLLESSSFIESFAKRDIGSL